MYSRIPDRAAGCGVPGPHLVAGGGDQSFAVRAEGDVDKRILVDHHLAGRRSAVNLPDAGRSIGGGRCQKRPARMQGYLDDPGGRPDRWACRGAGGDLPDAGRTLPLLSAGRRRQQRAVVVEKELVDRLFMGQGRGERLAAGGIPEAGLARSDSRGGRVPVGGGQDRAGGAEADLACPPSGFQICTGRGQRPRTL